MTRQQRWTLTAAVLGSGIVFLNSTVVTVALPRIGQALPTSRLGVLEAQAFVYNGYLLTLSATLILAGALSDYLGRRRVFQWGLVGFGVTSILCGLAPTMELLIAARVLQGLAGAFLVPGSLSILTAAFAGEEQGTAFGYWAAGSTVATIIGPFAGGVLVDSISWRAAFFLVVPFVLAALWATVGFVVESRDDASGGHFDWLGAAVVALAVGGLTLGLIRGQEAQWQSPLAWLALAFGVAATIAVPVLMVRRDNPLVPPELFASRNFTVTNVATFLIYGALYVELYFASIFLQGTLGYDATAAGMATIPGLALLAVGSARFGKLAGRYGPRWFMAVGPAIMAVGAVHLSRVPATSEPWAVAAGRLGSFIPPSDYVAHVLPGMLLFGAGAMMMAAPLTTALMASIPVERSGVGSGINNAISRIGPQLAGALIFMAVTAVFYGQLDARTDGLDVRAAEVRSVFAPLNGPTESVAEELALAADEASTDAFEVAMLIAAGLYALGAAVNAAGITASGAVPREIEAVSLAGQMCEPVPAGAEEAGTV